MSSYAASSSDTTSLPSEVTEELFDSYMVNTYGEGYLRHLEIVNNLKPGDMIEVEAKIHYVGKLDNGF